MGTLCHPKNIENRFGRDGSGGRGRLSLPDYSALSWSHNASDHEEDDIECLHLLRKDANRWQQLINCSLSYIVKRFTMHKKAILF